MDIQRQSVKAEVFTEQLGPRHEPGVGLSRKVLRLVDLVPDARLSIRGDLPHIARLWVGLHPDNFIRCQGCQGNRAVCRGDELQLGKGVAQCRYESRLPFGVKVQVYLINQHQTFEVFWAFVGVIGLKQDMTHKIRNPGDGGLVAVSQRYSGDLDDICTHFLVKAVPLEQVSRFADPALATHFEVIDVLRQDIRIDDGSFQYFRIGQGFFFAAAQSD